MAGSVAQHHRSRNRLPWYPFAIIIVCPVSPEPVPVAKAPALILAGDDAEAVDSGLEFQTTRADQATTTPVRANGFVLSPSLVAAGLPGKSGRLYVPADTPRPLTRRRPRVPRPPQTAHPALRWIRDTRAPVRLPDRPTRIATSCPLTFGAGVPPRASSCWVAARMAGRREACRRAHKARSQCPLP
jgi:hypothetical protein